MQSELPAVLQQSSPAKSPSGETSHPAQHGYELCGEHHRVSGLPPDQEAGDSSAGLDSIKDSDHSSLKSMSSGPFLNSSSSVDWASHGITIPQSPSRQAGSHSKRVAFKTQPCVSLGALPNEVLTHILSHLPPPSLSSIALVSRRFHSLVTTPHAWRIAFSRYFPGPFTVENGARLRTADSSDNVTSNKRYFSRLTALASWRSEYILRTRLLRSLSRGKPAQFEPSKKNGTVRSASVRNGSAVVTYTSQLLYPVSHLGASFGTEDAQKAPLFIHGASEQGIASASDPSMVKVGTWGLSDHQMFRHFADLFPGDAEYGLGQGDLVGQPNCMDVSQPYGMVYGEGCPQGRSYFISTSEQRGRFLGLTESSSQPQLGIPALNPATTAVTAVWIAKSSHILKMTGGLIGMLSGSSAGILSAFALGPHPTYEKRFERGQVTAKWAICPGVPIVGIAVDDNYSKKRFSRGRIWATVLNALGEIYYLNDVPRQPDIATKLSAEELDQLAWKTGRSVRWELIEVSRRVARPDPFNREPVDGSYSPRSSSDSMKLGEQQIVAETKEIERFLKFRPKHFRKVCDGWDMRRQLRVDFAGDDGHGAGESILVIARGVGESEKASIRRFTRLLSKGDLPTTLAGNPKIGDTAPRSIFGGPVQTPMPSSASDTGSLPLSRASSYLSDTVCSVANTEWRISDFTFGDRKSVQITTSALDLSAYAVLTADEDPLLGMSGSSAFSSAMSSPLPRMQQSSPKPEVPGQRGRYMAVGTATGLVFVWDIRAASSKSTDMINSVAPLRIIQTDSPQVSCVALTSLYLVHGGNDGLVQAWDPLASTTRPIRTINSRFSSRARRRLVQAEASVQGVGNNYFASGAICLDPDPTVLRGMVALGTHLRYWAYSSSAADQYKGNKRRLRRRGPRGSNISAEGQRFSNSGRGAIKDYIEDEKVEMERQKVADEKEKAHLSNRFGVDLLGPDVSEEQLLAYAQLLSEESFASEAVKHGGTVDSSVVSTSPSDTFGRNDSSVAADDYSSSSSLYQDTEDDIAEAIRLSLLDEGSPCETYFPVKYKESQSSHSDMSPSELAVAESSAQQELDDLEFAIQLSLAESQSVAQAEGQQREEYPLYPFSPSPDKGKGKERGL